MMSQLHNHSLNRQSDNQNIANYDLQLAPNIPTEGVLPPHQSYWFMEPYPSDNNPPDGYYLQPVPVAEPNYVPQDPYHQPVNYEPIPPLMGYSSVMEVPQSNAQYYVGHDNQQAYQFGYPTDPAISTQIMDAGYSMVPGYTNGMHDNTGQSNTYAIGPMPADQIFGQYINDHNTTGMIPTYTTNGTLTVAPEQDFWNSGIANYQLMTEPIQINTTHSNGQSLSGSSAYQMTPMVTTYSSSQNIGPYGHGPEQTPMNTTHSNGQNYGYGPPEQNSSRSSASQMTPIVPSGQNSNQYVFGPTERNCSRSSASQMASMVPAHSMQTTHSNGYGSYEQMNTINSNGQNYGHVPPEHNSSRSSASQMASMVPPHPTGQNFSQYGHGPEEQTSYVSSDAPMYCSYVVAQEYPNQMAPMRSTHYNGLSQYGHGPTDVPGYCNSVVAPGNQSTNPMSYPNQMAPIVPMHSNGQNFNQYAHGPPDQISSVSAPGYCNPVGSQGNQPANPMSYPSQMTSNAPISHGYCNQQLGQSVAPNQWTAPPTVQNAQHFPDSFPDVGHWGVNGVSSSSAKPVTTSRYQNSGKHDSLLTASKISMVPKQAATRMNQNGKYSNTPRYGTSNSGQQESRSSSAQTASKNGNTNYRMGSSQPATSSNVNYRTTQRNDPSRTSNVPVNIIPEFDSRIPPPDVWGVYGRAPNGNNQKTSNSNLLPTTPRYTNTGSMNYKPSITTNYKTNQISSAVQPMPQPTGKAVVPAANQMSSKGYTPNRNKSQFDEYGRSRPSPRTSMPANLGNDSPSTGQGTAPKNNAYGPLTVHIEEQSYPSTPSTEESKRNSKANLAVVPAGQKAIEIGPMKLNVGTVVCSEQIVLFIEMPAGYSSVQYFVSTKMTFEDEWTMVKVYGNTPQTVYQIRTIAGKSYDLSVTCQSNEKVFIGEWGGKVRSVFSHQEFAYLHLKCAIFIDTNQQTPQMQEISVVYRCKPKEYWDQIQTHCQRMMYKYSKVVNGQPANLLNGRLAGLFFSTFVKSDGSLPKTSLFGDVRFSMPAGILLDPRVHRLYFGDFYCRQKRHYVTLVVTRKGSEADMYCFLNLLSLHPLFNPYLKIIYEDNGNWRFFVATALTVDLFYTENVHTCFGRFSPVEPRGGNFHGVYPNDKTCRMCNLYPKQLMLH
ncbi:hypothetical protein B9Z55_000785 [Caenorhabditis nigoni]|uniref:Phytanoyl-CoA hydroxylase-interacting protein-like C-terminal domain-containing protein n=2 Tax=Caenorhabditis nigoni TaxID=1611254 RepID=A0A2G5VV83_9PELO|nr:hypothetical protein B9Z55_000785 [Caenorhabditis nigoni]